MDGFLYTLPSCEACQGAKAFLSTKQWAFTEILIDNPVLELGIQLFFQDRKVHAPVYVVPGTGVWIFLPQPEGEFVLGKILSLEREP